MNSNDVNLKQVYRLLSIYKCIVLLCNPLVREYIHSIKFYNIELFSRDNLLDIIRLDSLTYNHRFVF